MTPDKDGGTIRHGGASDYLAKHWQSQTFNKCVGLAIRTTRTLKGARNLNEDTTQFQGARQPLLRTMSRPT